MQRDRFRGLPMFKEGEPASSAPRPESQGPLQSQQPLGPGVEHDLLHSPAQHQVHIVIALDSESIAGLANLGRILDRYDVPLSMPPASPVPDEHHMRRFLARAAEQRLTKPRALSIRAIREYLGALWWPR